MPQDTSKPQTPHWPEAAARDAFDTARMHSHSAVQWLARMVHSFQTPASDGGHLLMSWQGDGESCRIITGEIAPGTCIEMRLPALELQFRDDGSLTKHTVVLDDKSPAEIEAWTLIELLHRGIDRDRYSKSLPYQVTGLLSGDARHYETVGFEAGYRELCQWFHAAAAVLAHICPGAALRFSPGDFALFARVHPDNGRPAIGNWVEAGLRAGSDIPCFYAGSKPEAKRADLPAAAAWSGFQGSTATVNLDTVRSRELTLADLETAFALPARLAQMTQ